MEYEESYYTKEQFYEMESMEKDEELYKKLLYREQIKLNSKITDKDYKKVIQDNKEFFINNYLPENVIKIDDNEYLIPFEYLDETVYLFCKIGAKLQGYTPNKDIEKYNHKLELIKQREQIRQKNK